jgi:predicted nucleic acid-binding protein
VSDVADVEAQIGQRVRKDAKVLVLPGGAASSAVDGAPLTPAAAVTRRPARRPRRGDRELFRSGRAQLVHLPEGFRFDGEESASAGTARRWCSSRSRRIGVARHAHRELDEDFRVRRGGAGDAPERLRWTASSADAFLAGYECRNRGAERRRLARGDTAPVGAAADVALSAVVMHELFYGAFQERAGGPQSRLAGSAALPCPGIRPRRRAGSREVRAFLAGQGRPIGPFDVLIAGQARARLVLVTRNTAGSSGGCPACGSRIGKRDSGWAGGPDGHAHQASRVAGFRDRAGAAGRDGNPRQA